MNRKCLISSYECARYFHSGNQLTTLESSPEGKAYEGRTGIGTPGRWTMDYDANGNLVSDTQRGITSVTYNRHDQPTDITMGSGEGMTYMYGHGGNRLLALLRSPSGATVTKHAYLGPAIFENDTLKMWLFAGGYFDHKLEPHYYVTDYQGNVTHDVTSNGYICQKTNYYPYGEPWQEPSGQNRYLFGTKERENLADLRLYDFGPRMLNSGAGLWYGQDKKSEDFNFASPYAYCLGNPIRLLDPSGNRPSDYEGAIMAALVYKDEEYQKYIDLLSHTNWKISSLETSIQMNFPEEDGNGLQSMLFERTTDGKTEYVYAFAGTNSVKDGVNDALQLAVQSPQYKQAIENARTLSNELDYKELTFVGHSLGGGEAAAAALATGRKAITYNPAAVSKSTLKNNYVLDPSKFYGGTADQRITNIISVGSNTAPSTYIGDPLYNVQKFARMHLYGKTKFVSIGLQSPLGYHSIGVLVDALKPKVKK